ncbi:uncharacterized protein LOC110269383 [Arachis ipaensis]|uniref:uncharacterized protein LOC110269383 n=1 Tax=Arachis ipaensis TaxID=130454 RepID=UPI000A2B8D7D|nr:uncharacterized protein LOC110269383 [Arachis ipaensis]
MEECKRQVTGFKNNDYKGFKDLDEAKAWLGAVAEPADFGGEPQQLAIEAGEQHQEGDLGQDLPNPIQLPVYGSPPSHETEDTHGSSSNSLDVRGGSSNSYALVGGVEGCPMKEGPFLHVEDMELLLMRACSSLGIGAPIFICQENRSSEEAVRFAFTVVLPYNSRGLELVAHGPTSADVRVARQEVSFAMLEKMVAATGYSICDYNYHTVARMEERWREIQDASLSSVAHWIHLLKEENADLQHQVEMINEMLEE